MTDLPVNVTFPANPDRFSLDQEADAIRSVQAFRNEKGDLAFELWGTTTVVTPAGNRREGREFQQSVNITFGRPGFTWHVDRLIFEDSHEADQDMTFQLSGTDMDVAQYRRV